MATDRPRDASKDAGKDVSAEDRDFLNGRILIAMPGIDDERFDRSISRRGYTNRSEAFRDPIRDRLVTEQTAAPDATVVGTVTLIYDHHAFGVTEKLTEVQHENHDLVVSTSHAHLDHESCLEVLIVHGKSARVEQFADRLNQERKQIKNPDEMRKEMERERGRNTPPPTTPPSVFPPVGVPSSAPAPLAPPATAPAAARAATTTSPSK